MLYAYYGRTGSASVAGTDGCARAGCRHVLPQDARGGVSLYCKCSTSISLLQ